MRLSKHLLCEDGFENRIEEGLTTGFNVKIRIPYYRGIPLSLVDDMYVIVDGAHFSKDTIKFQVHGGTFTFEEMKTVVRHRWNYGEKATLKVAKKFGLQPGKHHVEVYVKLRISYLPVDYIGGHADLAIN